jgi:polysaccharide export outer membrane protein
MNVRWTYHNAPDVVLAMTNLLGQTIPTAELGTGDVIAIHALHVPEISKETMRLSDSGCIDLPMIGSLKAVGLTPSELAAEIRNRLDSFVRNPEVTVDVVEVKSRPVSVLGAVKTPGVYQLSSQKRLLEVLATAGGADETAGYVVHVNRPQSSGPIPLPDATEAAGMYSVQISLPDLVESRRPETNIVILPHDVIAVPRARLVYVIGEVHKSGGFVLRERENMTVLQALSLAEGLNSTAGSRHARIIRANSEAGPKTELEVDVKNILAGKAPDVALRPNDILFIPNSAAKNATLRGIESAIQMGTGIVIWHH